MSMLFSCHSVPLYRLSFLKSLHSRGSLEKALCFFVIQMTWHRSKLQSGESPSFDSLECLPSSYSPLFCLFYQVFGLLSAVASQVRRLWVLQHERLWENCSNYEGIHLVQELKDCRTAGTAHKNLRVTLIALGD